MLQRTKYESEYIDIADEISRALSEGDQHSPTFRAGVADAITHAMQGPAHFDRARFELVAATDPASATADEFPGLVSTDVPMNILQRAVRNLREGTFDSDNPIPGYRRLR
jgi:hypothetical protein